MKTIDRVRAAARSLSTKAWREVRKDPLRSAVVGGIFLVPVPGSMVASAALAAIWKRRRSNPTPQDAWLMFVSGKYYLATKDGAHVVPIDRTLGTALREASGARRSRRSGQRTRRASGRSKSRRGSGGGQRRGNPAVRWSREDGAERFGRGNPDDKRLLRGMTLNEEYYELEPDDENMAYVSVVAMARNGDQAGRLEFWADYHANVGRAVDVKVASKYQRRGVASWIYREAAKKYRLRRILHSKNQTLAGQAFARGRRNPGSMKRWARDA